MKRSRITIKANFKKLSFRKPNWQVSKFFSRIKPTQTVSKPQNQPPKQVK